MLRTSAFLAITCSMSFLGGCLVDTFTTFPLGTFEGEVDCEMSVDGPAGEGEEPFTAQLSVTVEEFDVFTINGEPVELGAVHVRSLSSADMEFEIVDIEMSAGRMEITMEPRPTLPGISATGELVEVYERSGDDLTVSAEADLTINDVDGDTLLQVDCPSALLPAASSD